MAGILKMISNLHVAAVIESVANKNSSTLDLNSFDITTLPDKLYAISALSHLYLHKNKLTTVTVQLTTLSNLSTLTLDYNCLTSLPPEICDLKNLVNLNVSHNPIKILPPEIGGLESLEAFWCNRIGLKEIPKEIGNLSKLDTFGARGNEITSLPDEITQLTKLRWLTLEDNQIRELPPDMDRMESLVHVNLRRNRLATLPLSLASCSDLIYLLLNDNLIYSLPAGFQTAAMLSLELMDVRGNPVCDNAPSVSGSFEEYELASNSSVIRYTEEDWPPAETPGQPAAEGSLDLNTVSGSSRALAAQALAINATALQLTIEGRAQQGNGIAEFVQRVDEPDNSSESSEDWENSIASSELDATYQSEDELLDNDVVGDALLFALKKFGAIV